MPPPRAGTGRIAFRGALAAALLLPGIPAAAQPGETPPAVSTAPAAAPPAPEVFRGEDCRRCHDAVRDSQPRALHPESWPRDAGGYDAIVVGGGTAGLAAAYYLRDYKVLLLDKESRTGGKMRRESFDGHPYPVAAVYMGQPAGPLKDLFKALGLKIQPITLPTHTLAKDGRRIPEWLTGDVTRLPYPPAVQARLRMLQDRLRHIEDEGRLTLPIEDCDPLALEEHEKSSFTQWLDNNYGKEAAELGDLYSLDVFGISGREISSTAGLMYMASEMSTSYTFEGGLGAVPEALARSLGTRVSTGTFVWRVTQDLDGATVEYQDGTRDYRARARAVVLAVPSMVSRRIVSGLTDEKRDALAKVRYSSYALVPLRFKRVVWNDAFVLWAPGHFITDFTLPQFSPETLRGATEQALVAYIPLGEREGRKYLLSAKDEEIVHRVMADLEDLLPGGPAEVAEARVIRWGHAMPVPYPGYLTQVRPLVAKPEGRLFFAGVDTQLPAIEGAIHSGLRAAAAVRRFLKSQDARPDTP